MKGMRRVRSRQTITLFVLVLCFSSVSIIFTMLVRGGVLFDRVADPKAMRYVIFGFAIKDVLLLVAAIILAIISVCVLSKGATNPIVILNRATKEVAAGNFDVQVSLKEGIEEYGELQKNFNAMVRELKSNEYLRKDFISSVSHELKTPLSIINGYAKLLEEEGLSREEEREYIRLIAGETERLQKLCGDMLRLSKIDNQNIGLRKRSFSLDEQLRQAILLLESKWDEKGIDLELDLPACTLAGDEELLLQVWQNLLDNAIKFSKAGGRILVSLHMGDKRAWVSIRDFGEGMDQETQGRMFERFYQGDSSHKKEGSGLGLALVKRIVDMHGGSIRAVSSLGMGTDFTVELPL